jgi:hypothetical protein
MFKKKTFATDVDDQDELKIFKKIRRFGIFRVADCVALFPRADTITWQLKHVIWKIGMYDMLEDNP